MEMKYLPLSLNITDKKILIIGGGNVAAKKIKILKQFTSEINVVAVLRPSLESLANFE